MQDFQALFDAQKSYFASGVTRSYAWRIDQLDRMARMVSENEKRLQEAVASDFKTARSEYVFETVAEMAEVEFQKSNLRSWMEPVQTPIPQSLARTGHIGRIYREPYGVTLVIGPSNGPLLLLLRPAIAVLAAGNTCMLKLSPALSATEAALLDLVPRYFDPQAVCAVSGHRQANAALLELPFDFIFFTGSSSTGKAVARAAAEHLTPVILELGGQNPALVDETANVDDAARKIAWGATAWGGQWCTSPGYAYVHESVAEEFVRLASDALTEFYGDDPASNPDYSRIATSREVTRLAGLIDPDKVVFGGASDPQSRYMAPTIVYPVSWDDEVMQDEVFGPILPVLTYSSLDEAFQWMALTPRPLAGFVFSRNQETIDRFIGELSFGGGAVNQVNVHLFVVGMPFGGSGASGIGHYYGKAGFDMLTHAKSMLISPADTSIEHLFPPYTEDKVQALHEWFDYDVG
ncbi:MAG: aldehyde dehydrogenase [Streptomyces sp.]|nr:aldehyde dehydrogenase [Streptomyces sp.]